MDNPLAASAATSQGSDATPDEDAEGKKQSVWSKLGPGLITGAADDDPSGIATYTQAGARFGYGLGWTLLVTYPLMVGIQLASARIGRTTGRGLTSAFAALWPRPVVALAVVFLLIANIINLAADLSAMAEVVRLAIGGPEALYALAFGSISLGLQAWLPYRRYVRILKWLTLSLLAYVGVALVAHVDWATALTGALVPRVHWDSETVKMIVAVLGTTISPYLFFWQAAQEVEEIERVQKDQPLRKAPDQAPAQLRRLRLDTWLGMGFSNAIAFFMILAAAATLHADGKLYVESTAQAAEALRPIAGDAAFVLFALGILGTGLLALPVLTGSAAYACAEFLKVRRGLEKPVGAAPAFYAILAAAMVCGMGISLVGIDPMKALVWAAVINSLMSVPIMVGVMLAASSRRLMGNLSLPLRWRILGWTATAAMAVAAIAFIATSLISS
ncbi:Nramp family divalent metal transporter [Variovorax sp. RKNM96]|uniref:Nramp family divalent metal transporter n=1 Tax=Variovorax sp. RKNM96 TaxID=2681552 RepID=UPI0019825251|nr:Nramp family divalent metal transporter [Variovorax sp. RKNM96]